MTERLAARLRDAGFSCRVEARERLAIVIPLPGSPLLPGDRTRVLQLAREEGFTHVAIELDPDGATLPGD